jgi:hypothetical protein
MAFRVDAGWASDSQHGKGVDVAHRRPDIVSHWGPLTWPAVRVFKPPEKTVVGCL